MRLCEKFFLSNCQTPGSGKFKVFIWDNNTQQPYAEHLYVKNEVNKGLTKILYNPEFDSFMVKKVQ